MVAIKGTQLCRNYYGPRLITKWPSSAKLATSKTPTSIRIQLELRYRTIVQLLKPHNKQCSTSHMHVISFCFFSFCVRTSDSGWSLRTRIDYWHLVSKDCHSIIDRFWQSGMLLKSKQLKATRPTLPEVKSSLVS